MQTPIKTHLEATDTAAAKRIIIGLSVFVCAAVSLVLAVVPRGSGGDGPSALATLNACINASVSVLLVLGFVAIRRKSLKFHRACMLFAFSLSSLFLITYLMHHAQVGSVPFTGQGFIRVVYYTILVPHVLLAAIIVPMALLSIYRGWTRRVAAHRRLARWTLPLWLYVSTSGVAIYWMLYRL